MDANETTQLADEFRALETRYWANFLKGGIIYRNPLLTPYHQLIIKINNLPNSTQVWDAVCHPRRSTMTPMPNNRFRYRLTRREDWRCFYTQAQTFANTLDWLIDILTDCADSPAAELINLHTGETLISWGTLY